MHNCNKQYMKEIKKIWNGTSTRAAKCYNHEGYRLSESTAPKCNSRNKVTGSTKTIYMSKAIRK